MKLDPSAFLADPELIQALEKHAIEVSCGGDNVLFRQGDPPVGLYILNRGEVTLSMASPAGDPILSMHVGAGSLLGLPGLVGNAPYTLTAVAGQGAELSFLAHDDFDALMQSDPRLSLKVLEVLAAEVRSARIATLELRHEPKSAPRLTLHHSPCETQAHAISRKS
ncbi:MAG: cyclic nucleotide-binding domain-containing protein [Terracidiphilus sp.]|jgi:CRP-like cAMP-binding protein|nr:cyclic nucleotide-binding domain-containing protein [Terracidiphilus sp.]